MRRISLSFLAIAIFSACSDDNVPIGQVARELQERSDGGPTGNGRSCSWEGTVFHANAADPAALGGPYSLGEEFASPDGCNDCRCTNRGILCTILACEEAPTECTTEGLVCPDGSVVGRTGPNCEFAACPGSTEPTEPALPCTTEARICPDGSAVGRTGPNCEFAPCPGSTEPSACDDDAMSCPDGSVVGRTGPNCEFAPCPGSTDPTEPALPCTDEAKICPDGSAVGRSGPNCEFAPCP